MRLIVPLDEDAGLRSRVSGHFGRAPYLAVIELNGGRARLVEIRPNPAASGHGGGACGVMELLAALGADGIVAKRVGVRAAQRLLEAGVRVFEAPSDTLKGVLEGLEAGSLRPLDLASLASGGYAGFKEAAALAFYPPPPSWPPAGPGAPPQPPFMPPAGPMPMPRQVGLSGRLKIAFSTNGRAGLDDTIAQRFARCPTFTIVEVEDGRVLNVEVHENPYVNYPHGAGFAVAQFLANMGVKAVVASRFGPNAWQALASLGMSVHVIPAGTRVRDALRSLTG